MIHRNKSQRSRSSRRLVALFSVVVALCGGAGWVYWYRPTPIGDRYATVGVRRADLFPTRMASGRIESGKRTIIECQLENVAVGIRGQRLAAGGASVLLSLVPEGTVVKNGDVLAVLDSSDYEELLRLQKITLERATADHQQATLNLEIAKLAVREFRDGTMNETVQDFEGKILLARSDLERAIDRLNWSHRMNAKGYIPAAVVTSDKYKKEQATQALADQESAFTLFTKYSAPKTLQELDGAVKSATSNCEYQDMRLQRQQERLSQLERQVKNCTIRAPHDGFVIYANNADRDIFIEAGMPVRQRQQLFFLPDLNDMEVVAMLHESIVDQINRGMRATVHVEGLGNRRIEGHVTSVAPIATQNWRSDVHYFEGTVKLENVPDGIRPGMSAEVTIALARLDDVLTIPAEAIRVENGHDYCFVLHEDSVERREVKLGQVTPEMSEVTEGLAEGEQVVMNAPKDDVDLDDSPARADLTDDAPALKPASLSGVVAVSH